jgi:hypothetical protein
MNMCSIKFKLLFMGFISILTESSSVKFSSIVRNTIIMNPRTPVIYSSDAFILEDTNIRKRCSIEHIFPKSLMLKCHQYDMHNMIKAPCQLNTVRSNYKYVENIEKNDTNWLKLEHGNFVNHKKRFFIPNESSRGFISRSILYITTEYKYNYKRVIDKNVLFEWYLKYPPCEKEIYHNEIVREIQNTNNVFVSAYNKRNKFIHRIYENF